MTNFHELLPDRKLISDVFGWDVKNWSRALRFWAQYAPQSLESKKVLELGSNRGGLSLLYAKLGAEVVCSDLGGPPEAARKMHELYDVDELVEYRDIDARNIDYPSDSFDIVTFKSILGGIGRNENSAATTEAVAEIFRIVKPNGVVLFAENLEGNVFHKFFRNKYVRWGGEWHYFSTGELAELFSRFEVYASASWGQFAAFGRTNSQRDVLHYLDRLIMPLTSPESRYILFGAAKKS